MKTKCWTARILMACFVLWALSAFAVEEEQNVPAETSASGTTIHLQTPQGIVSVHLPLSSPEYADLPVAEVNGDPIPLSELNSEIMAMHADVNEQQQAGHEDLHTVLQRIINLRLLEQEARNIGFDETPDFVKAKESYRGQLLRALLRSREVKAVEPDEEKVAKLYKEMSTSVKLESVLFKKEEDAQKAVEEIKGGASYQDVVKKALRDKTAQGNLLGARSYSLDQLMPQVVDFIEKAKDGALSPVIATGDGFALIRVEEALKTVDSPDILEQARQKLLAEKNIAAVRAYFEELKKKYAVIHQDIIDGLDYSAETTGLEALSKDDRVIIAIKDEAPITVAAFTEELKSNLYHGSDAKENRERMNTMKNTLEENILFKKLFVKEALRMELDKTQEYEQGIEEFERKTLFSTFVNKVIVPKARVKEETVRKYYDEHVSEYSSPKMLRMQALVFDNGEAARNALDLLQKGTDFKWLRANAEHQVKKDTEGLLQFDSNILSLTALPKDIQEVVADAQDGDFRLYPGQDGRFYVLDIEKVYPATPTPYKEVRQSIAQDLFKKRIPEQIEEWAGKLRQEYDVTIYLVDAQK
jgi:hypothetical protein